VTWSRDAATRIRLRAYPGEKAIVHSSVVVSGDNLTVGPNLRVTAISLACGREVDGFAVRGANDVIEYNEVYDVARHGILTHTSASNATVHGNDIRTVGSECDMDHGIYVQQDGRITRNLVADVRCGYGIHLYSGPSNVIVAQNTSVGSRVEAGILVECSSNCWVVNNIFANNATHGITYRACSSGCVVDSNITWRNVSGSVGDSLASQATNTMEVDPQFIDADYRVSLTSPAMVRARPDHVYWPDGDGLTEMVGGLGAYG
jgi:parallel beta-helix repeat protein